MIINMTIRGSIFMTDLEFRLFQINNILGFHLVFIFRQERDYK